MTVSYLYLAALNSFWETSSAAEAAKNSYSFLSLKFVNKVFTLSNKASSDARSVVFNSAKAYIRFPNPCNFPPIFIEWDKMVLTWAVISTKAEDYFFSWDHISYKICKAPATASLVNYQTLAKVSKEYFSLDLYLVISLNPF